MKKKMYNVPQKKSDKITLKIKVDQFKLSNKMHLDAQMSYPALVQEDKRRKKPKHKGKIFDND